MSEPSFERIKEILAVARPLEPREREECLRRECGEDSALRAEVESLLGEESGVTGFLEPDKEALASTLLDAVAASQVLPEHVGPFRIVRRIASGGMGSVFEAVQEWPSRRVALKMIRADLLSPDLLRRFKRETELLGRLRHPGIAQVYDAGTADVGSGPQPYFAMEFVDGVPLTRYVRGLGETERLELFLLVCDAVHHAHQKGIIHRDLKPDNILVSEELAPAHGSHRVGQPKILDFGVARATDIDVNAMTVQTSLGQIIGTLPYMSPEQVAGDSQGIDTRSDVYALGVLLFEILSGRLPHDLEGLSLPDAAAVIRDSEPRRLSAERASLGGDLETIVLKALDKEPDRRYGSASELANDVDRFLRHEPILARPTSAFYQLRKFTRRHRPLVVGAVVSVLALIVALVVSISFGVRESNMRRLAEQRKEETSLALYRGLLVASQASAEADPRMAFEALQDTPVELRGWEWDLLRANLERIELAYRVTPAQGAITGAVPGAVAFGTEGSPLYLFASERGVELVDLDVGIPRVLIPDTGPVQAMAFAPEHGLLALCSGEAPRLTVSRFREGFFQAGLDAGEPLLELAMDRPLTALEFDAEGTSLAATAENEWSRVYSLSTGEQLYAHGGPGILDVALWPDGSRMLVGRRGNHSLDLVDSDGVHKFSYRGYKVAVGPLGKVLAFSMGHGVSLRDPLTEEQLRILGGGNRQAMALAFSEDAQMLAFASRQDLRVWEVDSGEEVSVQHLAEDMGRVLELSFSANRERLLTRTKSGACLLRTIPRNQVSLDWDRPGHSVSFSSNGRWVAVASGRWAALFETATGRRVIEFPRRDGRINGLSFTQGNATLLVRRGPEVVEWTLPPDPWRGDWGEPLLSDVTRWEEAARGAQVYRNGLQAEAVTRDGVWHAKGTRRGGEGFELFHQPTGEMRSAWAAPQGENTWPPAVGVYSDGSWVATGHRNGSIHLWSAREERVVLTLEGHLQRVNALEFHPTLPRLASGSGDGTIRIWDLEQAQALLVLQAHTDSVEALAFSPDGTQLISASSDNSTYLWDTLSPLERVAASRSDR